jgi:hypothetical protein
MYFKSVTVTMFEAMIIKMLDSFLKVPVEIDN